MSFDQGFADAGEQFCERDRAAILGPGCAIHAHIELAVGRKGTFKQDFEIFISPIILDRNSQICFHKVMLTGMVIQNNRARVCARAVV